MRIRSAMLLLGTILLAMPATTSAQGTPGYARGNPPKRLPGTVQAASFAAVDPGYSSEIMPIRLGVPVELKEPGDMTPPAPMPPASMPPAMTEPYLKDNTPINRGVRTIPAAQAVQGQFPPNYPPPGFPVGQVPPGSEQLPQPRRLEGEAYPPPPLNFVNPAPGNTLPAPRNQPMPASPTLPGPGYDTGYAPVAGDDFRRLPRGEFWARAEYLLWWVQAANMPPLVTTSVTQESLGRLGRPDTSVLFGASNVDGDLRQGGRFSLGYNLLSLSNYDGGANFGVDGSYFFLDNPGNSFAAFSTGDVVLARPFYNALTNTSSIEQVANLRIGTVGTIPPDVPAVVGSVMVTAPSEFWGGELNANVRWLTSTGSRFELLAGFRHLHLTESVNIREDLFQLPDATGPVGDVRFIVNDSFAARNQFNGGQLGFRSQLGTGRFNLELVSKLALGVNRQQVNIAGSTLTAVTGGPTLVGNGGLLALPTNIGTYERDRICFVPEVGINAIYYLTPYIRCLAGYNFLYMSSVVRPGDQIDLRVNPNFIPPAVPGGPARPSFPFNGTDLWVQGINLGLEVRY